VPEFELEVIINFHEIMWIKCNFYTFHIVVDDAIIIRIKPQSLSTFISTKTVQNHMIRKPPVPYRVLYFCKVWIVVVIKL
jgi:hypothetical protein